MGTHDVGVKTIHVQLVHYSRLAADGVVGRGKQLPTRMWIPSENPPAIKNIEAARIVAGRLEFSHISLIVYHYLSAVETMAITLHRLAGGGRAEYPQIVTAVPEQ